MKRRLFSLTNGGTLKKTTYSLSTIFIYMAVFGCSGFAETNCPGLNCVGVQLPPIVIADDYDPKDAIYRKNFFSERASKNT